MKRHGSLNHIFRLIWSHVLRAWVAVAETARGRGKSTNRVRLLTLATLLATGAGGAGAVPANGQIVAGAASIVQNGTTLTFNQSSNRAIVNWTNFSINQGETVQFNNGSGATLNRVLSGGAVSSINGNLAATGSVYLINPSGVIVGTSGVINVGGTFVASTQDTTNSGFMAGGALTFSGTSSGSVVNYGRIGALGGDVVLIASQVDNEGTITAPGGDVGLLAGYQVLLKDQADQNGKFAVNIGGAGTSATNGGSIAATAAELRAENGNIYALAGNTAGTIRATELSGEGGAIWLVAPGGSVQVASGATLDASAGVSGKNGGQITVQAGTPGSAAEGVIDISGTLDASSATGTGGAIAVAGRFITETGVINANGAQGGFCARCRSNAIGCDYSKWYGRIWRYGDDCCAR